MMIALLVCLVAMIVAGMLLITPLERRQKQHAEAVLAKIPAGDTEAIHMLLRQEIARYSVRRRWYRRLDRLVGFGLPGSALAAYALWHFANRPWPFAEGLAMIAGPGSFLFRLATIPLDVGTSPRELCKRAVDRAAATNVASTVGILSELLTSDEFTTRQLASEAIMGLLPHLTHEDADRITKSQMESLCRCLSLRKTRKTAKLQLAVLKALEQIGGADEIPRVEALTLGNAWTDSQATVRNAAEDCLVYLRQNAVRDKERMALLRPVDESVVLLRPVQTAGGPSASGEQLLHIAGEQ